MKAEVIFSRIETRHHGGQNGGGTSAKIRLKYRYFVGGREYTGHRFCFGGGSAHSQAIATQELVEETSKFDVSYCRSCPSLSVAKPGIQQDSLTVMGFGLGLLLLMFCFIQA
ncbi:DUF3592 domain-containing protein [Coraliomargarita sinensis]|uniref:DUF3592 domain-containing protein n=1 Tax=Coraliomargarita sinensis TaxID=2174842 RepID=UPI003CCCF988